MFPILNPPPSSLPIPLGRPSVPAPSIQYRASNLAATHHHFFLDITNSVLYRKFVCICLSTGNGDMYTNTGQRRIPGYSYNTVVYNILKWYQKSNCFKNIESPTFYKLSLEHALTCETHFWL